MARPLRIEFPGAWYHVMNRGARREAVFQSNDQRRYFLSLLADTAERFNAEWHACCLMDNHYHLMVRTPEGNLQRIMRQVNGLYTQYYNRTEGHDGPLFRGRYKAVLVDAEPYWLLLSRYIHRNPIEARMVDRLADYRWSSYPAYIGRAPTPDWLVTRYILDAIGAKRYASYVERGAADDPYRKSMPPGILGGDDFARDALAGKTGSVDQPELKRARVFPSMDDIVAAICRRFDVPREAVVRLRQRQASPSRDARAVAMYLCRRVGGMTLGQIATAFDLASYASASSSIRWLEERLQDDRALDAHVKCLLLDLTP